jgi:hypothetical protein
MVVAVEGIGRVEERHTVLAEERCIALAAERHIALAEGLHTAAADTALEAGCMAAAAGDMDCVQGCHKVAEADNLGIAGQAAGRLVGHNQGPVKNGNLAAAAAVEEGIGHRAAADNLLRGR